MEPLATREQLTTYLQGAQVGDDVADLALAGASGIVRELCGWHIAPVVQETVVLDGMGSTVLTLPTLKLVQVRAVRIDGRAYTDYVAFPRGQVYRCGAWPARPGAVELDIEHGFSEASDAVTAVVLELAAQRTRNPGAAAELRQLTIGGMSQTFGPRAAERLTELQAAQLAGVRL